MRKRVGVAILLILAASSASAQTREFLRGAQVKSRVRLQWDPGMQRVLAAIDDDQQFRPLPEVQPFLVGQTLALTYPRLNPLRIAAAAAPAGQPVAADAVTAQLRALVSMASVSVPSTSAQADLARSVLFALQESCPAATATRNDVEALLATILVASSSPTIGGLLSSWRQAIDEAFASGQDGPAAIAAAVSRMDSFVRDLDARLSAATGALGRIDAEIARLPVDDACGRATRTFYERLVLVNPRGRLAELAAVRATVASVRDALNGEYADATQWHGSEYRLAEGIRPPREGSLTTVIRVTYVRLDVDESSGTVVAIAETTASETIAAQRASRFVREFAIASVVSTVSRPQYGTTTDGSGTTVVAGMSDPGVSVVAALLASFVCRCQTGPVVAPMLQVGITTSKDVPALLVGGGLRLFGLPRGDVSLGAGGIIGWVKDLDLLRVGDAVGGTADIETDLEYKRRRGFYAALQYKF